LLQSAGEWQKLANLWQGFYNSHKEKPEGLKAIYWIGMAYRRLGQPEKAQALMAEHIGPFMADPKNEQVEVLIQQLVAMVVPKKRSKAAAPKPEAAAQPAADPAKAGDAAKPAEAKAPDAAAAPAPAAPAAAPQPTFAELEEQVKKLLTPGEKGITNGTVQARILYARALLARYMKDLAKFDNYMTIIPDAAKPDELSPLLLAELGKMLAAKGQDDKATEYFNRLREVGAAGEFGDQAPVGLGRIEMKKKEWQKALELFEEAISKYAASSSILEATQGKAMCLLELGKLPEAEKLFKTIFSVKDWGGEAKPHALYHLGQICEKQKKWSEAISYYQRIVLAHQKYKPWLAKAYLHLAQCFINDGKNDDAKLVLRQMLDRKDREGKNDLQDQPEFNDARTLLAKVGN
jgi:tetratricopeptide (TPR) repeat protein